LAHRRAQIDGQLVEPIDPDEFLARKLKVNNDVDREQ
jgi:hypothetical protein